MKRKRLLLGAWFGAMLLFLAAYPTAARADNTCNTSLTFGSGASLVSVCISNDGNLTRFTSPAGFEQINPSGTFRDGYAICTGQLPTFPNVPQGYDAGGVEDGFGPPTVIQPGGANTLPLTIIRTTTSGIYQLTQSFSRDSLRKTITVTMMVKRLSNADCSPTCPPVRLQRAFKGDVDNDTVAGARFATTVDSVHEWIDTIGNGLMLSNVQGVGVGHATIVNTVADYDPTGTPLSDPTPRAKGCLVFFGQVPTPTDPSVTNATQLVGRVIYEWGSIPLGASKTVQVTYRRF